MRWWDVTAGKQDFRLDGHSDYVRAASVNPTSPDMWATAGYDHICKLWDVRSQECVMNLDHGAPIEDVKFFPSGISSGLLMLQWCMLCVFWKALLCAATQEVCTDLGCCGLIVC